MIEIDTIENPDKIICSISISGVVIDKRLRTIHLNSALSHSISQAEIKVCITEIEKRREQLNKLIIEFNQFVESVFSGTDNGFTWNTSCNFQLNTSNSIKPKDHVIYIIDKFQENILGKANQIGGLVIYIACPNSYKQDRFLFVLAHELGHTLGLVHTTSKMNGYDNLMTSKFNNPIQAAMINVEQIETIIDGHKKGLLNRDLNLYSIS